MKPDICIFHGNCQDGFTAAWAIWTRWPDVEFVPGVYGQAPPDVTSKDVLLVDFSYKYDVLVEMAKSAKSITVLDHHLSAQKDLADFSGLVDAHGLQPLEYVAGWPDPTIQALFDMTKSGAMLAWEYAFPNMGPLPIIDHVQDRDLWRFALPNTREICADLFSRDYSFDTWTAFSRDLMTPAGRQGIIAGGAAIERKHHKDVAELLRTNRREMVIGGYTVPVANMPYTMASDAGNALAIGERFGATYYDDPSHRHFSLRADAGGLDVSKVAELYGGGGHAKAAGFRRALGWEGDV